MGIAALGVEGCWIFALLVVSNSMTARSTLPTAWLFSIYPIALLLNRGLVFLRLRRRYLVPLNILLGMGSALALTKVLLYPDYSLLSASWLLTWSRSGSQLFSSHPSYTGWLVLGATCLLWWRGLSLALTRLDFAQLLTRFQFGAGILLLLLFIVGSSQSVELPGASQYVTIFFLFALVGFTAARVEQRHDEGLPRQHRLWLSLVAIASVLLLGMVIGNYVTQDFLRLLFKPFVLLGRLIEKVLYYLASLFYSPPEPLLEKGLPAEGGDLPPDYLPNTLGIPELARKIGATISMGTFAVLILIALYRVSSQVWAWLWSHMPKTSNATLESLPGAWRADLKAVLFTLMRWLLGIPFRGRLYSQRKLAPLRQLYLDLQRWAARIGQPRQPQQTPFEFMRTLSQFLPAAREDLAVITNAYVQMRYGEYAPSTAQYEQVEQSWRRLRRLKLSPRLETK